MFLKYKYYGKAICPICKKEFNKKTPRHMYCSYDCQDIGYKDYDKNYRQTHIEYLNRYNKSPERLAQCRENDRKLRKKHRLEILIHYSGNPPKCSCCGEDNIEFLNIDHINHDGSRHRKTLGHGTKFYRWFLKNNFPGGFQILCFNCNCGREINGGLCPHKKKEITN